MSRLTPCILSPSFPVSPSRAVPTVSEYIQYRWLPRTARGIDVVSRKIIPVVADALATFGVSSVVAAKAIGEQGWTGLSNKWHFARKCTLFFNFAQIVARNTRIILYARILLPILNHRDPPVLEC